jgi:hypothetical protein
MRISASNAPRQALSPREQETARMVARGYPNKMIASVTRKSHALSLKILALGLPKEKEALILGGNTERMILHEAG